MSLGKLFNFKYLKQNVKKSKGLLTILVVVIPVITALILIGNNTSIYCGATQQYEIAVANLFGMYGIPVLLTYILYGYVYKKNSVDFVGSMPLTRSTIYVTNFIGGIILITIIQVLTALATVFCAKFLANIYIAPQMILDIFIVMYLSYIFVYSATTLAMTVSGNVLTQIVVTLLILFLIPFTFTFGFYSIEKSANIQLENRQVNVETTVLTNYTMPSILFSSMTSGEFNFFSTSRNIKTIGISIIYFAIGLYLFNKRKMENVEVSFSKAWVHLIVKGITLLPMVFILELLEVNEIFYWIAVALIFIYYCVYDFITNRKVSIKFTIPCFIVSFAILFGMYKGMNYVGTKLYQTSFKVNDIQSISVGNYTRAYNISNIFSEESGTEISITDKSIIEKVCKGLLDTDYYRTYDVIEDYSGHNTFIYLKFKLNNGKEVYSMATIDCDAYDELMDYIINNEELLNRYKEKYRIGNDGYIIANGKFLSEEDTKTLIDMYNNIDVKDVLKIDYEFTSYKSLEVNISVPQPDFTVYYYKNHELCNFQINPFLSQELFDKMLEISQKSFKELLEKYDSGEENYIYAYIPEKREGKRYVQDENKNYGAFNTYEGILEYASAHADEKLDMNDTFYVLNISGSYPLQSTIYLKETDELNAIIERDCYRDSDYVMDAQYYDDIQYIDNYYEDDMYQDNYEEDYVEAY